MTCTCDDPERDDPERRWLCDVHVSCDQDCRALENPVTLDEVRAALEHWREHPWLHGCSHGC